MIERNFFETIVAGENPASIIQPYNKNILLEKPVIVYKFEDAEFLRAKHIEFYNGLIYSGKFTDDEVENLKETRDEIMHVSAEDFFYDLACEYDIDELLDVLVTRKEDKLFRFINTCIVLPIDGI